MNHTAHIIQEGKPTVVRHPYGKTPHQAIKSLCATEAIEGEAIITINTNKVWNRYKLTASGRLYFLATYFTQ